MAFFARTGLLLLALTGNAFALETVDVAEAGSHLVSHQLLYAPAEGTAPGSPPGKTDLVPYDGSVFNGGDYWFGFVLELPDPDAHPRFLQLENPRLRHSEIWYRGDGAWTPLSLEGPGLGLGSHISHTPRVSAIIPSRERILQVMVRMSDANTFVPRIYVHDTQNIRTDTMVALFVGGLALGMVALLVAFNAVIAVYTQDQRYRALSIYLAATCLFLVHYLGYGQMLFWEDWIDLDQRLTSAGGFFVFAAYIPFALRMLSVHQAWYWQAYTWTMWLAGALELTVGLAGAAPPLKIAGGLVSISVYGLALAVALRGNRDAWLFLGASVFTLVGGTTTWSEQIWGIGGSTVGHMLFLWGNVITSLALVLILARHIVTLRAERNESQRTAEQAQANALDARQEARSRSAFLATMSHEIRTPLNGVLGMAELLARSPLSAEQNEHVATILRSGRSLMAILNDVLDYSKFERGQLVLEREPCDLFVLLEDLALLATDRLKDKPVAFELCIDASVPEVILSDETRLRQILENLISNAAKFTDEGRIALTVTVADGNLAMKLADSGIGIREADLPKLFERFSQADSSITRRFGGTGLGLAISKLLCEAMGGTITVTSSPGRGSTFTTRVPCVTHQQHLGKPRVAVLPLTGGTSGQQEAVARFLERWNVSVQAGTAGDYDASNGVRPATLRRLCCELEQKPLEDTSEPLAGYKLLVAEDNLTNQMVAEKTLTKFGAVVEIANNGQEALEMCVHSRYDLILMDCDMPVMDGYTASSTLRKLEASSGAASTPIVALTAHAGAEYRDRATACGMNAYLAKPLQQQVLLDTILQVCPGAERPAQP